MKINIISALNLGKTRISKYFLLFSLPFLFISNLQAAESYQFQNAPGSKVANQAKSEDVLDITSLMTATASDDIEGVKFFVRSGRSVIDRQNYGGATALHIAARNNSFEITEILINNGANLNILDNEGYSPAMRAASFGNDEIVEILADNSADLSILDSAGQSIVMLSANSGCSNCLDIIFKKYNFAKHFGLPLLQDQLGKSFEISRNQANQESQALIESYLDKSLKFSSLKLKEQEESEEQIIEKDLKELVAAKKVSKKYIIKKPRANKASTPKIEESPKALELPRADKAPETLIIEDLSSPKKELPKKKKLSKAKKGKKITYKPLAKKMKLKKQKFIFKKPPEEAAPKAKEIVKKITKEMPKEVAKEEVKEVKKEAAKIEEPAPLIIPVKKPNLAPKKLEKVQKKSTKKAKAKKFKFKALKTPKPTKEQLEELKKLSQKENNLKAEKAEVQIKEVKQEELSKAPKDQRSQAPEKPKKIKFKLKKSSQAEESIETNPPKAKEIINLNNYENKDSSLKIFKLNSLKNSLSNSKIKSNIAYRLIRR